MAISPAPSTLPPFHSVPLFAELGAADMVAYWVAQLVDYPYPHLVFAYLVSGAPLTSPHEHPVEAFLTGFLAMVRCSCASHHLGLKTTREFRKPTVDNFVTAPILFQYPDTSADFSTIP